MVSCVFRAKTASGTAKAVGLESATQAVCRLYRSSLGSIAKSGVFSSRGRFLIFIFHKNGIVALCIHLFSSRYLGASMDNYATCFRYSPRKEGKIFFVLYLRNRVFS